MVALSGSTGSVGSSLLALLLERSDVSRIYLLNRKGRGTQKERQGKAFREKGLDPQVLDDNRFKIVYLEVDLSRRDLGLASQDYKDVSHVLSMLRFSSRTLQLRDNVTHIIHSAWLLNFNLILESYERVHIAGVRHLIDLALASPQHQTPRLTFLSSIAAVAKYQGQSNRDTQGTATTQVFVPEGPIDDPSVPLDQGYGQSKYVSERILVNAVQARLRATIMRLGQLSGATKDGSWAFTESVPIIFRSSFALGIIPDDLPVSYNE